MMIAEWMRRLWFLIRRERYAADLEEEMRMHRELRAESMRERGMDARDADAAARRRFGNVTNMTEESRTMWGLGSLDQLWQDMKFGARRLRQRPGLSIPVVGVLALGIGATTAVFSAVDAAILRPLPFPRAHELYTIEDVNLPFDEEFDRPPGRSIEIGDLAAMLQLFTHVAAYASGGLNLVDDERPLRVNAGVVTSTFFSTLGVRPVHGRGFSVEEGRPNGPLAAVLSYGLWQGHFAGKEMVGRSIRLHGKPYTVVGIMPRGFDFPGRSQLWIPMTVPATFATYEPFRGYLPSRVIVRVRPGVREEMADAAVLAAWERVVAPATGQFRQNLDAALREAREAGFAVPMQRELLGDGRKALLVLLGATTLLLVIACANVANLLLSDAASRRREIAVRGVLGASRRRIVRQLLVESTLLSLTGASAGLLLAPAVLRVLRAMMPATLAGVAPAQLDLRVLAFAALLAVATSMLFGLWPATGATQGDASDAIKSGGGHGATAGRLGKARRALVVAEVALTVMLLVGAGLMLRSFQRLMAEDTGMNAEQVATLETSFPRAMPNAEQQRIINGVIERLASQPGIAAAGAVNDLPLRGSGGISVGIMAPESPVPINEREFARQLQASAGYFQAMGIRLLRGRLMTPADDENAPLVAVVSQKMADEWWPGMDPIGRTVSYGRDAPPITVVGVVTDVRERRMENDPTPQMYQSIHAYPPSNAAFVARGTLPSATLIARLSAAVREVAPAQAVYNVRMMEDVISASVAPRRTNTILIGLFAALALVLSALGVYAVVAYGVAQRTREFGIRAALGATGRDLVGLVSREMVVVIGLGLAAGIAGAWALSRILGSLLYEVDARDPFTFAIVPLVLLLPAIVATLVPAFRAMRVNPTEVMRAD